MSNLLGSKSAAVLHFRDLWAKPAWFLYLVAQQLRFPFRITHASFSLWLLIFKPHYCTRLITSALRCSVPRRQINWPDGLFVWLDSLPVRPALFSFPMPHYNESVSQWQMQVDPLCTKQVARSHLSINSLCAMCLYWHNRTTELALTPHSTQAPETNEVFQLYCWDLGSLSLSLCLCACVCVRMFCVCVCACINA